MDRKTKTRLAIAIGAALLAFLTGVTAAAIYCGSLVVNDLRHFAAHRRAIAEAEGQDEAGLDGVLLSDDAEESVENQDAEMDPEPSEDETVAEPDNEADEEEKSVENFDSFTDRWTEPSAREVSMSDVEEFGRRFKKIPASRKSECLQRSLNLLPDDHVMLLAGVLLDKTMDKEYLDMVFNDVLNRDEDVKEPILKELYKDKAHPCWADVAWIFDATGETRPVADDAAAPAGENEAASQED